MDMTQGRFPPDFVQVHCAVVTMTRAMPVLILSAFLVMLTNFHAHVKLFTKRWSWEAAVSYCPNSTFNLLGSHPCLMTTLLRPASAACSIIMHVKGS